MKPARVLAVLVLLLLLAACGGGGGAESADDEHMAEGGDAGVAGDPAGGEAGEEDLALGGLSDRQAVTAESGAVTAADEPAARKPAADEPAVEELPDAPALRPGDRIIKEGTISIEVGKGRFDDAFKAIIDKAESLGGDAVGSSTTTAENGDTFGSVTVRVPVEDFEALLVDVGDVGTVRNRDVGSQDVSAEYTDLESRLRHLQAQERFYLGLFDDAKTVQDAITVQQQLDGIQAQIEKAQGRLNVLDDRTSFSTLTVELFEPGAGAPLVEEDEPTGRPSLAHYWDVARDAFVNVVGGMLVVALFLLPLLVPLAVVAALWFGRRRSRPRPVVVESPDDEREPVGADL